MEQPMRLIRIAGAVLLVTEFLDVLAMVTIAVACHILALAPDEPPPHAEATLSITNETESDRFDDEREGCEEQD
ncbi:MAG: hypothetical protein K2R98_01360 [Gemmataceae bacterium]|nr:hypothetical protein [Gemmataceae bacterium]